MPDFENCDVRVVDAIMGTGKTASIVNMINSSEDDEKFIYITPLLSEADRIMTQCKKKNFRTPRFQGNGSKLDNLKRLIKEERNIASTHALFQKFDRDLISLCRSSDYILIMDEVAEVIQEYYMSEYDFNTIMRDYAYIREDTKQLVWREEYKDYVGEFSEHKRLIDLGSLVYYGNSLMCWLFPIDVFRAFRKIYILTYRFDLQLQRYYYDYYKLPYTYMSVEGDSLKTYHLVDFEKDKNYVKYDYSKLIHVYDAEKINRIGDTDSALSKTWYETNRDGGGIKRLKNNICNFFINVTGHGSSCNMWTTFKDYEYKLRGKGYSKGFLPLNSRATNEFRDKDCVVYPVNRYLNPFVKNFFVTNKIAVDEDGYALTEMLQFIWRSAIRDGKEIWIYVPSKRMRGLLENWIKENSAS